MCFPKTSKFNTQTFSENSKSKLQSKAPETEFSSFGVLESWSSPEINLVLFVLFLVVKLLAQAAN
jgi:hypothetical protein